MSILTRQFHYHEDGSHYEKWYYLARDTETGRVFVVDERIDPKGKQTSTNLEIEEFLSREQSTGTSKLRKLIGTLVMEDSDA